jgi:CRISPR-associated protein Csm5
MNNHTIRTVYQCNLQILTPVHVGSGEKLAENFDFFRQGSKIHVINSSKMFDAVEKLGDDKIKEFTRAVERKDIVAWLQKQGIHLDGIAAYSFTFAGHKTPREIHAHIRDAFGNPLIPSSSLKGALRTAIIRKLAKAENDFQVKIKGTKPKYMDQIICGELLGRDPKENLLRTLSVGDYGFQSEQITIHQVWVNRLTNKTKLAGKFPILHIEGISNNAASQGTISFDEFLPDKDDEKKCFNFKDRLSKKWLLEACQSLTQHTIKTELQFLEGKVGRPVEGLRRFYTRLSGQTENLPENEVIIQMAWGSGWRGMTGQLLKSDDLSDDLRKKLRLADRYLSFPFPKSRRLTLVDGTDSSMGWIKLSFIEMEKVKRAEREKQRQQISLQKERQEKKAAEKARRDQEEQLRAEWEGMSPEQRDVARLSMPDVSNEEVGAIFNRIDSFSPEKKIEVARRIKEWRIKKNTWTRQKKAQLKKVRKIKQILNEV